MEYSSEESGSVSEIEDLRKRIERLGRNSTENYTPVDSRCVSGQPRNLENGTFSSSDKSKQHNGIDKVLISIECKCKPCLLAGNKPIRKKWLIPSPQKHDMISRRIRRESIIKKIESKMEINGLGSLMSQYAHLKNLSTDERYRRMVELDIKIKDLMNTSFKVADSVYSPVDSRSTGGEPSNLINGAGPSHLGSEKGLILEKCKLNPYRKLRRSERHEQWHIRRLEEFSFNFQPVYPSYFRKIPEHWNINGSEDQVDNINSSDNKIDYIGNESDIKNLRKMEANARICKLQEEIYENNNLQLDEK